VSKTVFMLTDGDYSDYHVIGVYSTRKAALKVRAVVGGDIEEQTLDPGLVEINAGLGVWHLLMLRDGSVELAEADKPSSYNLAGSCQIWRRSQAPAYRGTGTPDVLQATVWAEDKKHAIKIVNEIRAQWIADGRWA
jgi:hypothetical protein